jgi:hypothetical protein
MAVDAEQIKNCADAHFQFQSAFGRYKRDHPEELDLSAVDAQMPWQRRVAIDDRGQEKNGVQDLTAPERLGRVPGWDGVAHTRPR